jgi:hypothetical protein
LARRGPIEFRKVGQSGLHQVAVSNRDFMSTRPSGRATAGLRA